MVIRMTRPTSTLWLMILFYHHEVDLLNGLTSDIPTSTCKNITFVSIGLLKSFSKHFASWNTFFVSYWCHFCLSIIDHWCRDGAYYSYIGIQWHHRELHFNKTVWEAEVRSRKKLGLVARVACYFPSELSLKYIILSFISEQWTHFFFFSRMSKV